jgi:transcriptional regulator with GAF, ATPase, and Fis domain
MARVKLKRILSDRNTFAASFLKSLDTEIAIQDAGGGWIMGSVRDDGRCAIVLNGEILGWAFGPSSTRAATIITELAAKEAERIALADEVLEKYREINLLYQLSEKLAATMELSEVALIALTESARLIPSAAGELVLRDEQAGRSRAAAFGVFPDASADHGALMVARALETSKGEIMNQPIAAFVVAPLKSKDRVIGGILLVNEPGTTYAAGDLKLLTTVASQAAPQIEHAALYEKALRDARDREEKLKRQIEALQIQIDESRTAKQVAEITETDYFKNLREKADRLRFGR